MIGATSNQLPRPTAIKLSGETTHQDDHHSSNSANDSFLLSELALDPVIRRTSPRHADHHRRASAWEPPPLYSDTPRFQLALAAPAHRDAVISVDAFRKKRRQRNRNQSLQQQKGLTLQDELACQERGHNMNGVETEQRLRQSDAALFSSRKGDEADGKEDVIPNTDDGCCGFATASKDGTIKVWQNNFEVKGVISSENVTCIKCNADQIVAIKDLDGVEVYDAEACKAICHFNTETNRTLAINESTIAVGNKINKIDVFERRTNGKILTLSGHNLAINALELDGGYTLYSCGDDSHIKIWDLRNSDAPVATLRGHSSGVTSLCLDDGYLFSGATDMQVKLWSLGNRKLKGTLSEHSGYITSLAVNDRYLFSGSDDSIIKVWDKVQLKYINPTLSSIATIDLKYGSAVAMTVVNDTLIVGSKNSIKVFSLV